MGKIISFSNQKGGVGKTTTCVNMAAYLATMGRKVLLVDIDPQGNATTGLGFSKSSLKKSVYQVLIEGRTARRTCSPPSFRRSSSCPRTSTSRARKWSSSQRRAAKRS